MRRKLVALALVLAAPAYGVGLGGGVIGGSAGGGGGGSGDFLADGSVAMTGDLEVDAATDCTATSLRADGSAATDGMSLTTGGAVIFCDGGNEVVEFSASELVFNDPGNDLDFRVEGGSEERALYLNAGTNRWTIGGDANPGYQLEMVAENAETAGLSERYFGTVTVPNIQIYRGRGTEASPAAVSSGDVLGRLYFAGQSDTGENDFNTGAFIGANADGNWSLSDTPTDFHIDVAMASTTRNECLTIHDNSGSPEIVLNDGGADIDFRVEWSSGDAISILGNTGTTTFGGDMRVSADSSYDLGSETNALAEANVDSYKSPASSFTCADTGDASKCDFGNFGIGYGTHFNRLDCQDTDGCDAAMTGAGNCSADPKARVFHFVNESANAILWTEDTTMNIAGNFTQGQWDTLTIACFGNDGSGKFTELSRSDN